MESSSTSLSLISILFLLVGGLAWIGGFIGSFVLALKSKRLSTGGIILGATSFWCGFGTLAFLGMAYKAVQQAGFDLVAAGGDPMVARKAMSHFKLTAGSCIAGIVLVIVFGH